MGDTVVGIGQAYTTVAAWAAAVEGTPLASGETARALLTGTVTDTALVDLGNFTLADVTSRIAIIANTGEEHTGTKGTGAKWTTSNTAAPIFSFGATDDVNLDVCALELAVPAASSQPACSCSVGNTQDIEIDRCLAYGGDGTGNAFKWTVGAVTAWEVRIRNTAAWDFDQFVQGNASYKDQFKIDFCTAYDCGGYSFRWVTPTNCISMNPGAGTDYDSNDAASDYNISSDTSAPGTNTLKSVGTYASYFVDSTTASDYDLSLLGPTSDGGIFGATGLDGTPVSGITTDILGNTRSATIPSPGAFEYVVPLAITSNVAADPTNPAKGATFDLSADIDTDTETITAAEWYAAYDPKAEGEGTAMDLGAGTTSREATDTVDTTNFPLGSNTVWVRGFDAVNGWGEAVSVAISVIVPTPQNVAAVGGDEKVTVTWDDVDYNDHSYTLYWALSSPVGFGSTQITGIDKDATSYEHTGRTNGVEYFYKVRAISTASAGLLSAEVSATPAVPTSGPGPDQPARKVGQSIGFRVGGKL